MSVSSNERELSAILNKAKGPLKLRDDGIFSMESHTLSKINYLQSSLTFDQEIESENTLSYLSEDDGSHALYDRKADKIYGASNFNKNLHWENAYLAKYWGSHAYEFAGWDDNERPIIKLEKFDDLELTEDEIDGILTKRMIAPCLSYLERCPETEEYVLCKCVLNNKGLTNISVLKQYHYLQYLDLSKNRITNLTPLGQLPFLMYLDVSHNELNEALNFKAPFNLMFANLAWNDIEIIRDLSDFWSLVVLDLSHNDIRAISGLENLKHLRGLNLSFNWITRLEKLNNLNCLKCLNVHNNIISNFEIGENVGLKTLIRLKKLSVSKNLLTSLQIIEEARSLHLLDFADNKIENTSELIFLKDLVNLHELDLRENPIRHKPRYFDTCLNYSKNLFILDAEEIRAETKVLSKKKFDHSIINNLKSISQHMLLSNVNYPHITKSIVPYTAPPKPLIVLVGPPSCLKGLLVDLVTAIYPKYVEKAINHTTRNRSEYEIDGDEYHFVTYEIFKDMLRKGEFYSTTEYFGNFYGLAQSEFDKIEFKKKVLITHSDLNGALLLRARGLRPTLILTIPNSIEMHKKYLYRKYYCRSLKTGVLQIGLSCKRTYEGLTRVKDYNQKKIVRVVKEIIGEIFKDIKEDNFDGKVENPDISINYGMTLRDFFEDTYEKFDTNNEYYMSNDNGKNEKLYRISGLNKEQKESLHKIGINEFLKNYLLHNDEIDPEIAELLKDGVKIDESTTHAKIFEDVIESRQKYMEIHWKNPGLFTQVLFTDELDKGLDLLTESIKNCVRTYHLRSPICVMDHHPKNHPLVKSKLKLFRKMMSAEGMLENELENCKETKLGFQNVEGKAYKDIQDETIKRMHTSF